MEFQEYEARGSILPEHRLVGEKDSKVKVVSVSGGFTPRNCRQFCDGRGILKHQITTLHNRYEANVSKAIYATAWDGTIEISATTNGQYSVRYFGNAGNAGPPKLVTTQEQLPTDEEGLAVGVSCARVSQPWRC